jgi:hypothetical protein
MIREAIPESFTLRIMARRVLSTVLLLAIVIVALATSDDLYQMVAVGTDELLTTENLILISLLYACCLAIPFMPGVELGLLIMFVLGLQRVVAAYTATLVRLTTAFLVGRLAFNNAFRTVSSEKMKRLLEALKTRPYLLIALLLNLSGNWVLGGDGGVSLMARMSWSVSFQRFVLTVALAVAPIPMLVGSGLVDLDPEILTTAQEPSWSGMLSMSVVCEDTIF